MKILVVDDEPNLQTLCRRLLSREGYDVDTASTGEQAIARLDEGWDLVLTDVTMPGDVDGLDVVREVRARGSADAVVMTGYPDLDVVIGALREGAYDFLIKPFTRETLLHTVARCAEKRRLSVALAREQALRLELESAYAELVELRTINAAFGHFVSPQVVRYVAEHPEFLRQRIGERITATVMFVDIRSFTPFAATTSPERALVALNQIFDGVVDAVNAEGGILNKFLGDGALALFGAPVPLPDHARAAARAALRAREHVERLAAARSARGREALRIGIGLNTGMLVAGYLGAAERAEYTVIGDTVNLAARLEEIAGAGQILLGPQTAAALGDEFALRSLPPQALAGMPSLVPVAELVGRRPAQESGVSMGAI